MDGITTIRRCIALPVSHSIDFARAKRIEQSALWELFGECWEQSTSLANWCVQRCLRHDVVRTPAMEKLPPMPAWPESGPSKHSKRKHRGLYGCAIHELGIGQKDDWWQGAMREVSSICRKAERKWRKERFAVLWQREQAPTTYRYPFPYPVHQNSWSAHWIDDHAVIDLALPGGHVALQLRGGAEFARQIGFFRQLVAGKIKRSELSITRQACHASHRPQMQTRGAQRESWRTMLRIMVEQEVQMRDSDRVLILCTDPNALWVAELDGRRAWVLNADHIQRAVAWLASHDVKRQRWAQDTKAERRASPEELARFNHAREKACDKHARRMSSWLHETAAHLVRFAVRQHVGVVAYTEDKKVFSDLFPWHRLKGLLNEKLQAEGIRLVANGIDAAEEDAACKALETVPTGEKLRAARRILQNREREGSHSKVSVLTPT